MPNIRIPLNSPVAGATHKPLQVRIACPARATNPPRLHLREMALKKVNLMLAVNAWRVGGRPLHAEVVPDVAGVDSGASLGNQLSASHRLPIPVGGIVQRDLDALVGARVGGILVGGGEVDIFGHVARAVLDGLGSGLWGREKDLQCSIGKVRLRCSMTNCRDPYSS